MENIAHTLFGAALGQTGLKKLSGFGMPTLMIAANLPDIDLLWSFYSETSYLVHHRGFTHSFIGFIPQMILLATLMYFIGKKLKDKNPDFQDVNFYNLLLLSFLGLLSHLGLDFLNDYGIKPFFPLSDMKVYGSVIFIVDAWFWLMLGGYVFLTLKLNKWLITLFSIFAIISITLIALFPGIPFISRNIYIAGVIIIAGVRLASGKLENKKLGMAVFSAFFIYVLTVSQLRSLAKDNFEAHKGNIIPDSIERYNLSPFPLDPFNWNFIAANNSFLYLGDINTNKPEWKLNQTIPTEFSDPYVQKALVTEKGKAMKDFSRFLFAYVKKDRAWIDVYLMDARYMQAGEDGFASKKVRFPLQP